VRGAGEFAAVEAVAQSLLGEGLVIGCRIGRALEMYC
jgi:hypothetical protein